MTEVHNVVVEKKKPVDAKRSAAIRAGLAARDPGALDRRSVSGRAFRRLERALRKQLADRLPDPVLETRIATASALSLAAADAAARALVDPKQGDHAIRLARIAEMAMKSLKLPIRPDEPTGPTLAEHLRALSVEPEAEAEDDDAEPSKGVCRMNISEAERVVSDLERKRQDLVSRNDAAGSP